MKYVLKNLKIFNGHTFDFGNIAVCDGIVVFAGRGLLLWRGVYAGGGFFHRIGGKSGRAHAEH